MCIPACQLAFQKVEFPLSKPSFIILAALSKSSKILIKLRIRSFRSKNSCVSALNLLMRCSLRFLQLSRSTGIGLSINLMISMMSERVSEPTEQLIIFSFFVAKKVSISLRLIMPLLSFEKGNFLNTISYKVTPKDHISAELLVFSPPKLKCISGAKQLKVPKALASYPDILEQFEICAQPKSQSLKQSPLLLAMSMFSGLRSRCITFLLESARKALVICTKNDSSSLMLNIL